MEVEPIGIAFEEEGILNCGMVAGDYMYCALTRIAPVREPSSRVLLKRVIQTPILSLENERKWLQLGSAMARHIFSQQPLNVPLTGF